MVVLGLDGGGTKTEVALVDASGQVVRFVAGGGLDPTSGEDWEGRLAGLVAGMAPVGAVLGLPYFGEVEAISLRQQEVAVRVLGAGAVVRNDVDVAFEGAMGGRDGVLILAGTGSMAWARGALGAPRAGGFGDAFGDEGSANWIGRIALNMVSRHLDGRRRSASFARGVLAGLGIAGQDLIAWTYGVGGARAEIAQVARIVAALAAEGNVEAIGLLRRAARELALQARAAAEAAGVAEMRWSWAGGVLSNLSLRNMVADALGVEPVEPLLPPVGGAVLAAAKAAGWDVSDEFQGRLARALRDAANSKEKA